MFSSEYKCYDLIQISAVLSILVVCHAISINHLSFGTTSWLISRCLLPLGLWLVARWLINCPQLSFVGSNITSLIQWTMWWLSSYYYEDKANQFAISLWYLSILYGQQSKVYNTLTPSPLKIYFSSNTLSKSGSGLSCS